ncbi:MAG: hypothetical protein MJ170_02350 [Alphaproteobacteria bacterium]|nr:hypothetical protein [Alphaproteobacteria bacterium]
MEKEYVINYKSPSLCPEADVEKHIIADDLSFMWENLEDPEIQKKGASKTIELNKQESLVEIQERMNKSDCYLFNNIDFSNVPMFAQEKLAQIFLEFEKEYKKSLPTIKSLLHVALLVLDEREFINKEEYRAYCASSRQYKKLMDEALKEYKDAGFSILFEYCKTENYNKVVPALKVPYQLERTIFIEHLNRYPCKLIAAQRVSKLRSKVRKIKQLSKWQSVGF